MQYRVTFAAFLVLAACDSSDPQTAPGAPDAQGGAGGTGDDAGAGGQDAAQTGGSAGATDAGLGGGAGHDADLDADHDAGTDAGPDPGLDLGAGVTLFPSHPTPGQPVVIEYRGALAASSNVSVHYGFNGWNEIPGLALTSQDDGTGNLDFSAEKPMLPIPGGWQASVDLPIDARALHLVLFTESAGTRTWDSNGGQDFNAGFPVVLHGPALTWDGTVEPHNGVVVNFHTGWPCRGRVSFGPGAPSQQVVEDTPSRAHHIRLHSLQPSTPYSYQVSCDDLVDPTVRTFRSAPVNPSAFSFAVIGDIQETGEANRWKRTADMLLQQEPNTDFVLCIGDMPWNDRPGLWWTFFDQGRELLGSRVLLPVQGNHDINLGETQPGNTSLERWFALDAASGSETQYVQRFGSAAFVVLNSQLPDDFAVNTGAQFLWASQVLMSPAVSSADWVFASWHDPPYNTGARHWLEQGTFRDLTSLLDGKVDWLFSGHEHLYQRMKPLRYNGMIAPSSHYGNGPGDGVGYLVVPAAGAWPEVDLIPHTDPKAYYRDRLAFPQVDPGSDAIASSENGYTMVRVSGNTIQIETWGVGGPGAPVAPHLVDQVAYSH